MLQRIDRDTSSGALTFAVNEVLIDHGPPGLSLRRIGAYARMSPSTMLHYFGSREGILRISARETAQARLEGLRIELRHRGVSGLLPVEGHEFAMLGARAWLGWLEMWRATPWVEGTIEAARAFELHTLAKALDYQLTRTGLESVYAMADGLSVAVCAPRRPMAPRAAAEHLEAHTRDLLLQAPQQLTPAQRLRLLRGERAPAAA